MFHWCLYPLQGLILLQGNQVNELPPNPDEPGKHLFEIAPGRPASLFTFCITSAIPSEIRELHGLLEF